MRKVSACALACSRTSSLNSIGLRQYEFMKKSRIASRPHSWIASRRETIFPSDFDIFSPVSCSIPLCIHMRANSLPAPRDWASSFSWWGKIRSFPPP